MTKLDDIRSISDIQELKEVSNFPPIEQRTIDNLCDRTGFLWETTSAPWENTVTFYEWSLPSEHPQILGSGIMLNKDGFILTTRPIGFEVSQSAKELHDFLNKGGSPEEFLIHRYDVADRNSHGIALGVDFQGNTFQIHPDFCRSHHNIALLKTENQILDVQKVAIHEKVVDDDLVRQLINDGLHVGACDPNDSKVIQISEEILSVYSSERSFKNFTYRSDEKILFMGMNTMKRILTPPPKNYVHSTGVRVCILTEKGLQESKDRFNTGLVLCNEQEGSGIFTAENHLVGIVAEQYKRYNAMVSNSDGRKAWGYSSPVTPAFRVNPTVLHRLLHWDANEYFMRPFRR